MLRINDNNDNNYSETFPSNQLFDWSVYCNARSQNYFLKVDNNNYRNKFVLFHFYQMGKYFAHSYSICEVARQTTTSGKQL